MALDRATTLRKAEKLLRQGRLDAAIAEFLQVIKDQPQDWNTTNILGDLYVRAGQVDKAVGQYTKIADHLAAEGFFPKAAAVYKKILKIKPGEEHVLLQLAEVAVKQGLLADAKSALASVADRRRARGDRRGAAQIRMRLGTLDPLDLEARLIGARAAAEIGETPRAVNELKDLAGELSQRNRPDEAVKLLREAAELSPGDVDIASSLLRAFLAKGDLKQAREHAKTPAQIKEIAADLQRRGQETEALKVLAEAAALDPADLQTKQQLARAHLSRGDIRQARKYLTRQVAGEDTQLLWTLAELELRGGNADEGMSILETVLTKDPARRDQLVLLGCSVADISTDAAYRVIELAASASIAKDEWADAAAALNEFVSRAPGHIPALMRLVEICVDGGLEATMNSAQGQLTDAYLAAGQGAEARVIAEDLVAREPWDRVNIERFRRALTLLGETDVDATIADRLAGQTPFVSTDLFPTYDEEVAGGSGLNPPPEGAARPPTAVEPARPAVPPAGAPVSGLNTAGISKVLAPNPVASDIPEVTEVDLSNMLEELKPSMSDTKPKPGKDAGLDSVFKDFRDEVSRENFADVAAQHFKLASAYVDMGMVDDAVKALEVAVRAPRLRFDAASMLARLYLKKGVPAQAIEWFERAAEAPAPNPDAGRALLYELADTLEAQGETARALAVFMELHADVGEYRDLAARLERLTKVQMRG